ncbi:hypothetical protein RJ55_06074 [Drechmeria coniospora]|nr:hypothetical protein RJ55_06074 [Drechmeria coniospora]
MAHGAIAGTVVGVVAAVVLLFCLYPVVVHWLRRRRHGSRPHLDAESNVACAHTESSPHGRLSSNDSLKQEGDGSRGDVEIGATRSKDLQQISPDGSIGNVQGPQALQSLQSAQPAPASQLPRGSNDELSAAQGGAVPDESVAATQVSAGECEVEPSAGTPYHYMEYMPESEVIDDNPGVLTGTSADYYRSSIPSEAFGMMETPSNSQGETPLARRSGSRASSLKYNVRRMFRRRSGRESTLDSYTVSSAAESWRASAGDAAPQQNVTNGDPTASPTQISPTITPAVAVPGPSSGDDAGSSAAAATTTETPPRLFQSLKHSPSPPSRPGPGTVNPMDIMPATTEAEVWHQTEHRLHFPTDSSASWAYPPETNVNAVDASPSPVTLHPPMSESKGAEPTEAGNGVDPKPMTVAEADAVHGDNCIAVPGRISHDRLSPLPCTEPGRRPSCVSDRSTPFAGANSTDGSSHNTPLTQLDSPSPGSMNSSDFRHSVSPQPVVPASKSGSWRCDEPGCHQQFDQPHKLRHHQRYHSKDHKCNYPNCGKGFGTKTHLQRHINDRHEKKKKFHCSVPGCDYSRAGGKGFPRKDNWKRHMMKIHKMDQAQLSEPVEVDEEMTGT